MRSALIKHEDELKDIEMDSVEIIEEKQIFLNSRSF